MKGERQFLVHMVELVVEVAPNGGHPDEPIRSAWRARVHSLGQRAGVRFKGGAGLARTPFIEPGSPRENAYSESFNRRLRDEFLDLEIFTSMPDARVLADRHRKDYNFDGPHSSLEYLTPAEFAASLAEKVPLPRVAEEALDSPEVGEAGFGALIPMGDPEAMAAAMYDAIINPPVSQIGRERTKQFSVEPGVGKHHDLFERLVKA